VVVEVGAVRARELYDAGGDAAESTSRAASATLRWKILNAGGENGHGWHVCGPLRLDSKGSQPFR